MLCSIDPEYSVTELISVCTYKRTNALSMSILGTSEQYQTCRDPPSVMRIVSAWRLMLSFRSNARLPPLISRSLKIGVDVSSRTDCPFLMTTMSPFSGGFLLPHVKRLDQTSTYSKVKDWEETKEQNRAIDNNRIHS